MGPISSMSAGGAAPLRPTSTPVNQTNLGGANGVTSSATGLSTGRTDIASQLQSTVSQLLQGAGSGASATESLKALFILLIILALLQQLQDSSSGTQGGQGALQQLGSGMGGGNQSVEFYSSTTSITFEQTTTMISFGSANPSAAFGGDAGGSATGQNLDVAG